MKSPVKHAGALFLLIIIIVCIVETVKYGMTKGYDIRMQLPYYETATGSAVFEPGNHEQEMRIDFERLWGYPFACPQIYIHTVTPHKNLYIKEVSFVRNGKKSFLIKNMHLKIRQMTLSDSGYYGEYFGRIKTKRVDVKSPFRDMEIEAKEKLVVTQIYTFDDEPLRTRSYTYTVYCYQRQGGEIPWYLQFLAQ